MNEANESPRGEDAPKAAASEETGDDAAAVSRRGFLRGLGGSLATAALTGGVLNATRAEGAAEAAPATAVPAPPRDSANPDVLKGMVPVTVTVNGAKHSATVDVRRTLLEMLRSDFDLTGTKLVCNHATCGACTVILEGRTVFSCTTLAVDADGKKVETIEGLAHGDKFHPLQTAFVEHDALMCGFCTSGFLMSCKSLLDHNAHPTLDEVKTACAGNICRCGTYPRIFEAVLDAAGKKA